MARFDRIITGEPLPLLHSAVTREDLVRYAGGADDYVRQHWDHPFMIESGFPDVVVHGWLTFAHMCRAVEAWLTPEEARIAQFSVRYLAPTYPGTLLCGGEHLSRPRKHCTRSLGERCWRHQDNQGGNEIGARMTEDLIRDRINILDLLARYTYNGDRGRIDALAACFADDGTLEFPGSSGTGPAGVAAVLAGGERNPAIGFVRHHITNPLIELDGDRAAARSYFSVISNNGPDHSGTYDDKLLRTAAGWRFAHRRVRIDWQAETSLFRRMTTR